MWHTPVLLKESLEHLNVQAGQRFIDTTVGDGGHTVGILESNPKAKVLALDWDEAALTRTKSRLESLGLIERTILVVSSYTQVSAIAKTHVFLPVDGIIFDLGYSSPQIDDPTRGFSFQSVGPLDMRFNKQQKQSAYEVVNNYPEIKLAEVIQKYGEEKFNKQIARQITNQRKISPISDTRQIFRVIKEALPKPVQYKAADVARRVFQALRIEVNDELNNLKQVLPQALGLLAPRGRLVVITFHSLEDRIVKKFFQELARDCVCPPEFPTCVCDKTSTVRLLTKKPIKASSEELAANPRSKPAKLRAIEKL